MYIHEHFSASSLEYLSLLSHADTYNGYDPEDGFLPDKALSWLSSLDERLGNGRNLQANKLSVGLPTISLIGIDSNQNRVWRSISVEAVAQ